MSNDAGTTLTPEQQYHTDQAKRWEAEMSKNEYDPVSRVRHNDFLRVGVPILAEMISDTFQPRVWVEYTGHEYCSLEVIGDNGEVIYKLPPLLRQGLTVVPIETRDSLGAEAEHHINRANALQLDVSGELAAATERALIDCYGTLENATIRDAINTMETLTRVFADTGYGEDALNLASDIAEAKASLVTTVNEEVKPAESKAIIDDPKKYDFL